MQLNRLAAQYTPYVYALLRVVAGLLFLMHGMQKLFDWPQPAPVSSTLFTVVGWFEIVAASMIMVGAWTRVPAFIASGLLAVAYFMAHQPAGTWPIQNRGEPAVLLCFIFLYIAARGSGVWSVDARRDRAAVSAIPREDPSF